MGPTRRVGVITALALALLGLAAVSHAEEAEYQCFSFGKASYPAKGSLDKSVYRQLRDDESCPGIGCAAIKPVGDINREVGSSYEAYCLFDPKRVNVSEVYFQHQDNGVQFKIPHEVLNNSAIKVVVQHDEMIDYKLKCMMTYKNLTKFLCERKVNIGYPPQDVQNMTCISKNWEQLNCSWVEPPNPVRVQYILTYVVAGFRDTSGSENIIGFTKCKLNKEQNRCVLTSSTKPAHDAMRWYNFTLTSTNELGKNVQHFFIDQYASVIPKPAEDLTAHVEGPHSVRLSWKLPYPIDTFPGKIRQEVSYRERPEDSPLEDLEWLVVSNESIVLILFQDPTYNKTIDNLYAYMQYDFRVRLHTGTGSVREHMWSDAAVTTQKTDKKLPTAKVRTDIGTFEIEQNVNSRDIYVNWQKIDFVFKNGPGFHYEVDVFDADTGRQINKTEKEIHEDYAKFINMENNMKFRFDITPVNGVGPGGDETKATVIVPEKSKVLTFPSRFQVIVYKNENNTIYGIKWNITEEKIESQKIESVSIYWCKRRQYEERCLDKLDWVSVNPRLTMKNITDLEKETMYIFGISANSNKSSSGIKWITCIASHGNKLPPIDTFDITEVSSTEAELEWNLGCKDRSADPTGFNISYCITPRNETNCRKDSDMHFIAVSDASAYRINVTSLLPYTRYIFSIASQSELGMSRWSKSLILETSQDKPSGPPRNVTVVDKGQQWIYLAWNPPRPEERNGVIVTYKIKSEPAVNIDWPVAKNNSEVVHYNITGLEAYTEYKFKIVACTQNRNCGNSSVTYEAITGIGVPGQVEGIYVNDDRLQWNLDECNGPSCYFEIRYGPEPKETYITERDQVAVNLRELGINCTEHNEKIQVEIRAVSQDSQLRGEWTKKSMKCPIPGIMPWWLILIIAVVCIIATVFLVAIGSFGQKKVKLFLFEWNRELDLPTGLGHSLPAHDDLHSNYKIVQNQVIDDWGGADTRIPVKSATPFSNPEEQELIPDKARQSRNPSGDSGTSENDQVDSSGCSTGSESDSSSGSHRVPQSSDSGTGTEVGFPPESKNWESGSLRLRTPVPPYVRPGLPQNITSAGYVSVSSVPNLPVGSMEDGLSLQQSTSSLALGTPSHQPLGARRASTGYISMPDQDAEGGKPPPRDVRQRHPSA
ncbi:titin-like isoform X1 [Penaeus indicus]|uniref:titin-like isoform X1 n=1 Tax=Penaeus indicus TaxID=29960 RepID=UPI00300C2F1C